MSCTITTFNVIFLYILIIYKINVDYKKNGVVKRAKSLTKKKSRKGKSASKLRRTRSHRNKPSGVLTRFINRKGKEVQIPKGPPSCVKNKYDEKNMCYIDPINLSCLTIDNVVQNPLNEVKKKCFNRDAICKWLKNKPLGVNDDPETRRNFEVGWINHYYQ